MVDGKNEAGREIETDSCRREAERRGKKLHSARKYLTDARVAGQTLALAPRAGESRKKAKRAWSAISGFFHPQLILESAVLVPAFDQPPYDLLAELDSQYRRIRLLVLNISSVDLVNDSEARVKEAARALAELAVSLDEIISGEDQLKMTQLKSLIFCESL